MAIGDSAGLLFKIKGDSSDAVAAIASVRTSAGQLDQSVAGLGSSFSKFAGPAAIATGALAAMTAAAVAATVQLFDLAKSAASYGAAIFDASQKTGLAAETISALKFAAEQGGSSFEKIEGAVAKFNVILGEANQGNEKARATLEQYGITATDTDGALKQAITTIGNMTSADQRAVAAKTLFRDRTGEIIPVILGMNGNLDETIKKVKSLGLAMDDDAAAAADALDDTLQQLDLQIQGVARQLGVALIPAVTRAASAMSEWLEQNQSQVSYWSSIVEVAASNVVGNLQKIANWFSANTNYIRLQIGVLTGGLSELAYWVVSSGLTSLDEQARANQARRARQPSEGAGGGPSFDIADKSGDASKSKTTRDTEAERAKRETERRAAADLSAQLNIEKNLLKTIETEFSTTLDTIREEFSVSGDIRKFVDDMTAAYGRFNENIKVSLRAIEDFERQQLGSNATDNQKALLAQEQQLRFDALVKKSQEETRRNVQLLKDEEKAVFEGRIEALEAEERRQRRLYDLEMERLKLEREKTAEFEKQTQASLAAAGQAPLTDPAFQTVGFGNLLMEQIDIGLIDTMTNAFQQLGQAIGAAVSAFVLYGNAGTSVRKVTAQILAAIAQQAAIESIYQFAQGLAKLAMAYFGVPQAGPSATAHFASAAMFAAIAGTAAVAGRVVAGNAFKGESGAATGSRNGVTSGPGNQEEQDNDFGGRFRGFGGRGSVIVNPLTAMIERQNLIMGKLDETIEGFSNRVESMPVDEVVRLGAPNAQREIRGAIEDELNNDTRASETLLRLQGVYA